MSRVASAWLVIRALYELARYDVMHRLLQVRSLQRHLPPHASIEGDASRESAAAIGRAVALAACLYWKPVRCLQRSICLVRLLRARGVPARLIIGYRPVPFLSHAWVEVNGCVVNDSQAYQGRLRLLLTA